MAGTEGGRGVKSNRMRVALARSRYAFFMEPVRVGLPKGGCGFRIKRSTSGRAGDKGWNGCAQTPEPACEHRSGALWDGSQRYSNA